MKVCTAGCYINSDLSNELCVSLTFLNGEVKEFCGIECLGYWCIDEVDKGMEDWLSETLVSIKGR